MAKLVETKEQFLREAPPAWRRYGDALDRTSLRTKSREIKPDGAIEEDGSDIVYRCGNGDIRRLTLSDAEEWIVAKNADYAFWLVRPHDSSERRLQDVCCTSEVQASQVVSSYLRRSFFPDFLYREDSLLDAIDKPYFDLLSIEHEPTDEYPQLYRVEFDYDHPFQKSTGDYKYNWVQNGTLWLDAANSWVMVRSQVEYLGSKEKRSLHSLSFEFAEPDGSGIRIPTRRLQYYDLSPDWDTSGSDYYEEVFETVSTADVDPQVVRLSHYGFPEPVFAPSEEDRIVQITVADQELKFGTNEYAKLPFTLRNVSKDHVTLVQVIAC